MNTDIKVYRNYTRDELVEAFTEIENSENWKLEISATIDAEDYDLFDAAAIFFTGAGLSVELEYTNVFGVRRLHVYGAGYYKTIGA